MYHTRLQVICNSEFSEILIAELSEAGFDTFMENENGFEAYAEGDGYDKQLVNLIREKYLPDTPVLYTFSQIEKKNWNEEWEKNYVPIVVENKCLIRASFHQPEKRYPYEIIITPKMSFGTGHHQTTYLMVKNMIEVDHLDKRVMDAGCGTAILSIMASKLGAKQVEAFDIDVWSVENGNENVTINQRTNIHIQQGTIAEVGLTGKFDVILANINKNVLMQEMRLYSSYLFPGGFLLISGFFSLEIPELLHEAGRQHLIEVRRDERETWAALLLQKNEIPPVDP